MKIIEEKEQQSRIPEREGYVAYERTVNAVTMNVVAGVVGIPIIIVAMIAHFLLWKDAIMGHDLSLRFWLWFLVGIVVAGVVVMVLFELLHGMAWCLMAGVPLSKMRLGFVGNGLVFQARLEDELITKRDYVRGLIVPDLLFAAVLIAVGLGLNLPALTFAGALVVMSMVGDVMLACKISDEEGDTPVYIHPSQAGVYAYRKE